MSKDLSFAKSSSDPLLKLVMQEQRLGLHCNSIYSYLSNPRINVIIDIKNTIKHLDLHLIDNVIRAKCRLINSELTLDAQTPLFLPNHPRLVELIVQHIHQKYNNCGLSQTLSVYCLTFWSPKILSCLKSIILRCVTCRRQRARTIAKPAPPPLPVERVQWQRPYTTIGVDHTGHFHALDAYSNRIKLYICLFICATTRAVHLEVVDNLSANSFISCLRRLSAAKGMPSVILSDNHRTFISGEKFLLDLQKDNIVQEFLKDQRIPMAASDAAVPLDGRPFQEVGEDHQNQLVSNHSQKTLHARRIPHNHKGVEPIVNMRPLTYQSNDTRDQPLTHSQLLWGRDISIMPPFLQPDTNDSTTEAKELRHRNYLLSNAVDRFRKHWSSKYLTSQREKHINYCAEKPTHQLKPGSLVMVRHTNLHRYEWPLGEVVRVFPDPHWIIRSVEVEGGGKVSLRSVSSLVPLELDCYDDTRGTSTKLR